MASRWRIRHKLMLGLGLVVALVGLLMAGGYKGLASFRATRQLIDSKIAELQAANDLREKVEGLADKKPEGTQIAEMKEKIAEVHRSLANYQEKLNETIKQGRDQGRNEAHQVDGVQNRLERLANEIKKAQRPRDDSNAGGDLLDEPAVEWALREVARSADDLCIAIYDSLNKRQDLARKDYTVSLAMVLSTAVIGILLMAGLLRSFYCWLYFPVRDLQRGAGRVAQGDFDHTIEVHSGDELEDLAVAFNYMTGRLREMYRDLARQVNERSRQLVRSERLASVGFLAAGVAHEINNPLASILFCSEALESRLADILQQVRHVGAAQPGVIGRTFQPVSEQDCDTVTKYLKMIQQESYRCKEITRRLLEFSRGGERRREQTDLGEIVQSVLDIAQHLQSCRGKETIFQPTSKLVAWVNGQEIKSVVLNLVVNALDSMDEGGTLTIQLGQREGMAEITFTDTGCGMPAEVLENIFEPFFTKSRTGKGTGLGLSISHRIINQHGGEIEAASAGPNQGSTFTVRVPMQPPAEEPRPETKESRLEEGDPESIFQDLSSERRKAA